MSLDPTKINPWGLWATFERVKLCLKARQIDQAHTYLDQAIVEVAHIQLGSLHEFRGNPGDPKYCGICVEEKDHLNHKTPPPRKQ